jgi:hypothetical protein
MAAVIAVTEAALWSRPQSNRITTENFHRIRQGMTRADVEAILGPAGDYTTRPAMNLKGFVDEFSYGYKPAANSGTVGSWASDACWGNVMFDDSGRVNWSLSEPYDRAPQLGTLDSLRWRLKRQWHRWFP